MPSDEMQNVMLENVVRFLGLLCCGLAAGIALCILLVERAWSGSGQFYTELMQLLNRALTVPAPALGAGGLVALSVDAVLLFRRGGGAPFWLVVAAIGLALVAMAVTKLGHFPINDQVLKWNPASPPPDWTAVQARWSALHVARTLAAVGSFVLLLSSTVVRG